MSCHDYLYKNLSPEEVSRRWFLQRCGVGLGSIALSQLFAEGGLAAPLEMRAADPLAPKAPHFAPKAKRVIFLFMAGAPSHLELFDYKPQLAKFDGTLPPADLLKGYRAAFINPSSKLLGPKFKFVKCGQSGTELCELLPQVGKVVDDIAIVKSMVTDAFNHAPGQLLMNTGTMQFGRPSMGAWVLYGLGSETKDLPSFVVFSSGKKGPSGGNSCWGSGFLPTVYQGVQFRSSGDPVLYLSNPRGVDEDLQRDTMDSINKLNRMRLNVTGDPEIATRINSFETAFRMQSSAPELMDLSREPKSILEMYGAEPGKPSFANNCLLARRLVERGVRFVQLYHEAWDQHDRLVEDLRENCKDTDQASAALIQDLKQRGMLNDTLVIWGGEFGRTPMVQGAVGTTNGRDHHPNAFTMWLAGGGIKPGITLGESDELGFNVTKNKVHVHDLQATLLHLLGFEHTKLTYKFQGRNFRLTDVAGNVVQELLA
ncbi:MAG: sulfatase [Acidobacteria bacterium 13_1_20CM_2_60_10]|nr:MAG: sulfatase [Acidobacteria bacterium 13_1_20CM_2_60_10]